MKNYDWPTPASGDEEWPIPRELVHIIGVIVINWNWCESVQEELIHELLPIAHQNYSIGFRIASRIIRPMGNRDRSNLFTGIVAELELPPGVKSHLEHFSKCFEIGRENRNLIVHADILPETNGPLIQNRKAHPHISVRYIPFEMDLLIGVAKELEAIYHYGCFISDGVLRGENATSPEKPALPRKLTQILPTEIIERIRPQSSQA